MPQEKHKNRSWKDRIVFGLYFTLLLVCLGNYSALVTAATPNIQYDGIYRSVDVPFIGAWGYLRFFENGTLLYSNFSNPIDDLKNWYVPGGTRSAELTIPVAEFLVKPDQVLFTKSNDRGVFDYVGRFEGDTLFLVSQKRGSQESHQRKFVFLPVYSKRNVDPTVADICAIQEYLTHLGFDPGPVDGLMGTKTLDAMNSYTSNSSIAYHENDITDVLRSLKSSYLKNSETELDRDKLGLDRPPNGRVFSQSTKRAIAPLAISTSANKDFFVKLEDIKTGKEVTSIYIRADSSASLKTPLGKMIIKYASGPGWFSKNCLFGVTTSFNQAEKIFNFFVEDNQVSGYEIELIIQEGGNLPTRGLSNTDW